MSNVPDRLDSGYSITGLDFSPDGKALFFSYGREGYRDNIGVYLSETGSSFPLNLPEDRWWREPNISSDGRKMAVITQCSSKCPQNQQGPQIALVDLTSKSVNFDVVTSGLKNRHHPVISPDGGRVYFSFGSYEKNYPEGIAFVDLKEGKEVVLLNIIDEFGMANFVSSIKFLSEEKILVQIVSANPDMENIFPNKQSNHSVPFNIVFDISDSRENRDYEIFNISHDYDLYLIDVSDGFDVSYSALKKGEFDRTSIFTEIGAKEKSHFIQNGFVKRIAVSNNGEMVAAVVSHDGRSDAELRLIRKDIAAQVLNIEYLLEEK